MSASFTEKHNLLGEKARSEIERLKENLKATDIKMVRMVWSDSHGQARAKLLPLKVFLDSFVDGYNTNVATFTLDSSGGRVFRSFIQGGGMDLDEMTGSPNLVLIPDPSTFRILPWAGGVGWVMCDEYFTDGKPFYFSSRRRLREQTENLAGRGASLTVGLEIEWYLRRVETLYTTENTGVPGQRGKAIDTLPVEPGYSYHSETNLDLIQPLLNELYDAYQLLKIPLRSIENEYGPGQVECTFSPTSALTAADNYLLFRTATRQICRRHGYFATFMCKPHFEGYYPSGWHLHQSLTDLKTGENLCTPDHSDEVFSQFGRRYLAGLLEHAPEATVFATPTVNGYQRFKPNSLAPDRATWSYDHRGAMLRVLGGPGDPSTRVENRIGEPAANPYLFIASQIVCGMAGIENHSDLWDADPEPYEADRPKLPGTLGAALAALDSSALFRKEFGDKYIDYYLALKRAELSRYEAYIAEHAPDDAGNGVSGWERDEYFDFF
ncbi:MAG: glutamine synthetase family protein [Rhodospirillaceae bacterium]